MTVTSGTIALTAITIIIAISDYGNILPFSNPSLSYRLLIYGYNSLEDLITKLNDYYA